MLVPSVSNREKSIDPAVKPIVGDDASVTGTSPLIPEWALLLAISLAFFVVEIYYARIRLLWFDELSTLVVASQPTLREVFRAMPTDGNPLLLFLLDRLCLHLPLRTELAMRLPSILAFHGTALAVYLFMRRIAARPFALLAMCLLMGSQIAERYATEARAYSLLLFFTAALLCCWQVVRRPASRPKALLGIAVCTSCAILAHPYGILYALIPVCVGEAVRWHESHRLDLAVLLYAGLGSLTILLTYPPMLRGQHDLLAAIRASSNYAAHPKLWNLIFYDEMWPKFIFLLVLFVIPVWGLRYALIARRTEPIGAPLLTAADLAVADTLALFLSLMLLCTHFGTGYFQPRYTLGSALGLALLMGMLTAYANARWPHLHRFASLVSFYCVVIGLLHFTIGAHPDPPIDYGEPLFASLGGTEPIVVADSLDFPSAWWYANSSVRTRLHYLSDLPYALQRPYFLPELSLYVERRYTPVQMDNYTSFIASHREFLIYSSGDPKNEWLQPRLIQHKWSLRLIAASKSGKLYRALAP